MITVRPAQPADAAAIGAVHVAAWRSAYPGILPDSYLSQLNATRQARSYGAAIAAGATVMVAAPLTGVPRIAGFATAGTRNARVGAATAGLGTAGLGAPGLGDGEIETLYVLDDWRDQGIGRRLIRAAAADLAARGCRSAYVWVLRDNPSKFFYQHIGGQQGAQGQTRVAGVTLPQLAFCWNPIDRLLAASPA